MKYTKPNLQTEKFTSDNAILAEFISATGTNSFPDESNEQPSYEVINDAFDVLFGD